MQISSKIITTNKQTPSLFYRPDALSVAQQTVLYIILCFYGNEVTSVVC